MDKTVYYDYFNEKILSHMYSIEEYRIKLIKKIFVSSFFMFLLGVISAVSFLYLALNNNFTLLLLPVFLFFMYVFFIKSIINAIILGKEYQKMLVEKVLPYFFEPVANFKFWPKNNDTLSILDSKLFENFDTQEDVSSIFGIYNNTNVIVSDTRLTLPIQGAVKTNLFKGTLIQLELPESIQNHIVLISKNLSKTNKFKQFNPHVDDLNKYLYAFAKNQNNLELINEDFWDIIKRIGNLYLATSFRFSYNKNVVLIALEQKKPWQFGFIFKSLLNPKNYDELIDRFTVIFDLVDYLSCFG